MTEEIRDKSDSLRVDMSMPKSKLTNNGFWFAKPKVTPYQEKKKTKLKHAKLRTESSTPKRVWLSTLAAAPLPAVSGLTQVAALRGKTKGLQAFRRAQLY